MDEEEQNHPREGIPRPDWTATLKQNLTARFFQSEARTAHFCRLLKRHNALVAGGFLLKAIQPNVDVQNEGWKKGDIDLYVNVKNTRPLMEAIFGGSRAMPPLFEAQAYKGYLASLYCRSFMRQNGIRGVKSMAVRDRRSYEYITLDIVSIRNYRTPVEVVTNFDLTFCQLWFDGESVYATHPEHIEQRRGQLQDDYVETYLAGNRFLKKRIEKYRTRGFEITFDHTPSDATILHQLLESPQPCHKDRPYEDLVRHAIHRTLCLRYGQRKSEDKLFDPVLAIPAGRAIGSHRNEAMHQTVMDYVPKEYHLDYQYAFLPHEGYDSTEEEDMKALRADPANQWSEEAFQRDLTQLFVNTFSPLEYVEDDEAVNLHGRPLGRINLRSSPSMPLKKYTLWRSGMLSLMPRGEDMFGVRGPLLSFHQHDAEGGITPKALRTYVDAYYEANGNPEEARPIPCFYQEKCTQMLTSAEQECALRHYNETEEEQERSENENANSNRGSYSNEEVFVNENHYVSESNQEQERESENEEEKNEQEEKQEAERPEAERPEQRGGGHRALRYTRRKKNPSSHKGSRPLTRKRT